ncbi:thioesterase domain-containing protein, partial [Bradyrhizobium sp. Cp5.3]|uniref:thioesterase domain-containing protein n=1 Tax=Bradyrhizobium sp. Cp5.3 TaxID=443598 RepID=UPI001FD93CF2
KIWAELLGLARVGRHDHFFELGGHSLLAVQLLSRAVDLGLKFSAADIFQAPVLKELASKIRLEPHPSDLDVICARATGSQPPLFFVPTGLGDCSYVLSLVTEMDVDCPVYTLPWPPFDKAHPLTLESIASQAILAIKQVQSQGPYRVAGYSSGGILGYAIAQRLLKLDEAVSFIAFIDVTLPANRLNASLAQVVREVVLESLQSLDGERFELLQQFAKQCSIAELLEKALQIGALPPHRDLQNQAVYERIAQFQRALQLYQVPSLPIEIHQYYAVEPLPNDRARAANTSPSPEANSPMRGWDRVLSTAAIHAVPVPGNHVTIMSIPENRKALALSLSRALNNSL